MSIIESAFERHRIKAFLLSTLDDEKLEKMDIFELGLRHAILSVLGNL
jgi:hypothetical protein